MSSLSRSLRAAALATLLGCFALPAVAAANDTQRSIMMDDDLMLYEGDTVRNEALQRMKALGVDTVRVTVLWSVVAKNANDGKASKARKKRFKRLGADNPKAYPYKNWDRYDNLDRACAILKITCYFDVTGPGPRWVNRKAPKKYHKDQAYWKPSPTRFYRFVRAVAKRYDGSYRDENTPQTLPRISFWGLWNEPNQGGWLRPQWLDGKPASPYLYRDLFQYGRRALVSRGHGGDVILVGETAPTSVTRKTTTSAMGPKRFINEFLCGPGSVGTRCSRFKKEGPIRATAWAHHPYTKNRSPLERDPDPERITMANLGDLTSELDKLAGSTGNIASGMPIMSTEFGYETNPPDPFSRTTPAQQAQYNQLGDLITYLNPRVIGNTQFLLRDAKPNRRHTKGSRDYWGTYQSGLFEANGNPKAAAIAYQMPFLANPAAVDPATGQPTAQLFGQLRFLPNVLSPQLSQPVQIQFKPADGSSNFVNLGAPITVTNLVGYYTATVPYPRVGGQLRAVWSGSTKPGVAVSLPQNVPAGGTTPPPPPPPPPPTTPPPTPPTSEPTAPAPTTTPPPAPAG